ncbi:NAD(P)-binding protein, partial [Aureobasidium melanogenum]
MSNKPIFVATHPRACSTAFERVFMTQRDTLQCVHEPFGDAFYFGPERLSVRYEQDQKARAESGFENSTYKTIFDNIMKENEEGKRIFIKDITHYLSPPDGKPASIAPSLMQVKRGVGTNGSNPLTDIANGSKGSETNGAVEKSPPYPYATEAEPGNPTVVPTEILNKFHFAFLIRHPKHSIPSYWRCTIPPLDAITGFYNFMPSEAGYDEQRRLFDYLRSCGQIGPKLAGQDGEQKSGVADICVIDADDLLDNPSAILEQFCKSVGIEYSPSMLNWDNEEDHTQAKEAFEKWKGFHEDAINSTELKPRTHKKAEKSDEQLFAEWTEKYGEEAAKIIQQTVADNIKDYEHMKQFAIKVARHLTTKLVASSYTVHSIIRKESQIPELEALGSKPIVQSIEESSVNDLAATIKKHSPNVVIWSAGAGGGAIKVFDATAAAGVKRFIIVSAVDIRDRGNKPTPEWYNDDDNAVSKRMWGAIGVYCEAKLAADRDLVTQNGRRKLDYTIVRPGSLNTDKGSGKVAAGKVHLGNSVSREDIAEVIVQCIKNLSTIGLAFDVVGGETPIPQAIEEVASQKIDTFEGHY